MALNGVIYTQDELAYQDFAAQKGKAKGPPVGSSELGLGQTLEEIPEEESNNSASSAEGPHNPDAEFSAAGSVPSIGPSALPQARAVNSGRQVLSRGQVSSVGWTGEGCHSSVVPRHLPSRYFWRYT